MNETTTELIMKQLAVLAAGNEMLQKRCDGLEARLAKVESSLSLHDPSLRQDLRELLTYLKETSRRQSGTSSED